MKTIKKINKYTEDHLDRCGLLGWIYLGTEVQEQEEQRVKSDIKVISEG